VSLLTESSIVARPAEQPGCPDTGSPAPDRPAETPEVGILEAALVATETRLARALQQTTTLTRQIRDARDAARTGNCRGLDAAIDKSTTSLRGLMSDLNALRHERSLDVTRYLTEGHFAAEVTAAACSAGIRVESEGDRLVSYPSVVRVRPELSAVEIDGRRESGLRASNIVAALEASRKRVGRFQPAPFLEALEAAYLRLTVGEPTAHPVVRLAALWELFTLRPGSERDYSRAEFGRDLNLLDESRMRVTRAGRSLVFSASSGPRVDGAFTALGRDGRLHLYWGVSFS
jgi:hypothetical protein